MKDVATLIKSASSHVGVSWPLDRAVAVNPLLDAYDQPFVDAVTELERQLGTAVSYTHLTLPTKRIV